MLSLKSLLLAAGVVTAIALPQEHHVPRATDAPAPSLPPTSSITTGPAAPATTTTIDSSHCDFAYCDGTSSWCHYWAGVTSYDPSRGPVPGEVRTAMGSCSVEAPVPTVA